MIQARRPGLDQALAAVGAGDILVVWRLDRLGRSLPHLIETVRQLGTKGAGFASVSEAIDTTTPGGTLIVERTKAGLTAARKRGKALGRPRKLTPEQITHALEAIEAGLQRSGGMTELLGVDYSTLWQTLRS